MSDAVHSFGWDALAARLPRRQASAHKGTFGRLGVFAGAPHMPGAALLCLQGALRSGVGRVHWHTDGRTLARAVPRPPEALLDVCDDAAADGAPREVAAWAAAAVEPAQALSVGSGLGTDARCAALLGAILRAAHPGAVAGAAAAAALGAAAPPGPTPAATPCCLDADALNLLAARPELRAWLGPHVVLTPHPAEMARLLGCAVTQVLDQPQASARAFAQQHRVVVLLKGSPTTVAAPDGDLWTVGGPGSVGGPALAHAGTGDVLCGLLGGLLAQGLTPLDAACAAAFAHAAAGDEAAKIHGEAGTLPSDVALALGAVWRRLNR